MSIGGSRSWEGWAPDLNNDRPAWGNLGEEANIPWDAIPPAEAGDELCNFLISLKLNGSLSARQACILAFFAFKAGAIGPVQQLAMKPDCQTGKYSQRFDKVAGTKPDTSLMYDLPLALRRRHDTVRTWTEVPVRLPLEELAKEIRDSPEVTAELRRTIAEGEMPKIYTEHPVVTGAPAGELVYPLSIYMDGIAHTRLDSALAVWCYFSTCGKRHLLAILRRSEMCNCGCKGWCTLFPLWCVVAWQLASMASGRHPSERHDGSPFRDSEAFRLAVAGSLLGFRILCIFLKSDIVEYSHSLGFPAHNDTIGPCPLCFATLADISFDCMALSPMGTGRPRKTPASYDLACRSCEVTCTVTSTTVDEMRHVIAYDKSKKGPGGRILQWDFPDKGLLRRDRLEPNRALPDIAAFETRECPFLATFWRKSSETSTRHRNPLFGPSTGLSANNIGLDWLHILSLGIIQSLLMWLLWDGVNVNVYGIQGSAQAIFELTVLRIKGELEAFYQDESRSGRHHTRVQAFVPALFGTNSARAFRLHGAETNGFLRFFVTVLPRWVKLGLKLPHYVEGVRSLVGIIDAIREFPRQMPTAVEMEFVNNVAAICRACSVLGIQATSKHHFLQEMAGRSLPDNSTTQPPAHAVMHAEIHFGTFVSACAGSICF